MFMMWCGMKTYVFKVKLEYDKRVWRRIEVLGSQTLDDLHMAIQDAYDFDADPTHLYSFFMSGKAWDKHSEYCHPEADGPPATKVKIESLSLKPKQKFLYLFDYGDEWRFEVEFLKQGSSEKAAYPHIIDSRGKAPEQYPDYEEEN